MGQKFGSILSDFKIFAHESRTWFFFLARTRLVMRPNGSPSWTISPSVASLGTPRKCRTRDGLPAWAASSFTCGTNTRGFTLVNYSLIDGLILCGRFSDLQRTKCEKLFLIGMTVNDRALELKWTYEVYYFIGFCLQKYLFTNMFENCA